MVLVRSSTQLTYNLQKEGILLMFSKKKLYSKLRASDSIFTYLAVYPIVLQLFS